MATDFLKLSSGVLMPRPRLSKVGGDGADTPLFMYGGRPATHSTPELEPKPAMTQNTRV